MASFSVSADVESKMPDMEGRGRYVRGSVNALGTVTLVGVVVVVIVVTIVVTVTVIGFCITVTFR